MDALTSSLNQNDNVLCSSTFAETNNNVINHFKIFFLINLLFIDFMPAIT